MDTLTSPEPQPLRVLSRTEDLIAQETARQEIALHLDHALGHLHVGFGTVQFPVKEFREREGSWSEMSAGLTADLADLKNRATLLQSALSEAELGNYAKAEEWARKANRPFPSYEKTPTG